MKNSITSLIKIISISFVLSICTVHAQDSGIKGWYLAGSSPSLYEIGLVDNARQGSKVAYLRSKVESIEGFGTIMQSFEPGQFLGKKVRLTADIKANNVENWSGMWMRVDGEEGGKRETLSFDNMFDRAIKGTKDWTNYEIILEVPKNSTGISYGVLVNGRGEVLIDNFKFEIIDSKAESTGNKYRARHKKPTNTGFDESGKL